MKSRLAPRFRKAFKRLPGKVRNQARSAFRIWLDNPHHPSLRFKRIHPAMEVYSVRIGIDWRAVGIKEGDVMVWFWIGSHEEYDKLVSRG